MQVTVTDNGGLSSVCTLTLVVVNVDEPPFFLESPIPRTIKELPSVRVGDALKGTVAGVITDASVDVRDPEPGAVTISIADGRFRSFFALSPPVYVASLRTTQVFVVVANASVLDYETLFPDYAIQLVISAVDVGGHVVNSTLTLAVEDVNEAPVVADQSYALDVAVPVRVTLVARDPDSQLKPQFSRMSFVVTATNDTAGNFSLDANTGVITGPARSIDSDSSQNAWFFQVRGGEWGCVRLHSWVSIGFRLRLSSQWFMWLLFRGVLVQVVVSDAGGESTTVLVELFLSNANVAPFVQGRECSVPENSPPGTALTTVTVTDVNPQDTITAVLFGIITDEANVDIVRLVPTLNPRVWTLVVADGLIDFEANPVRIVGVRVSAAELCARSAASYGIDNRRCNVARVGSRRLTTACLPS